MAAALALDGTALMQARRTGARIQAREAGWAVAHKEGEGFQLALAWSGAERGAGAEAVVIEALEWACANIHSAT